VRILKDMISLLSAMILMPSGQIDARLTRAYRTEKAGWIYAHLEGKPRNIGYQYGFLLAPEIDEAQKTLRATELENPDWNWYRTEAKRLYWSKLDSEYQEELAGLAEGMVAKGFKYDVWDMLAFNAYIEIDGYYLPWLRSKQLGMKISGAKESCSAFVATGSQTSDGKIVMGHNLWWSYPTGQRFNAMLDIKPEHGNRILMDAFCGFIHSGSDFAINSAGLMLCETTISGFTGYDPTGIPEFQRMRKAIQYGKNLDDMARIFKTGNNGGYANTWLMGDSKTGEIGRLQLGLKNVVFDKSKDGYFVGANFPEDPKLIKEEIDWYPTDPKDNSCLRRKFRWESLMSQFKGQIDGTRAQAFLADTYDEFSNRRGASDSTLCGRSDGSGVLHGATNAKVATSDSVKGMSIWARQGFTNGSELIAVDYFTRFPKQKERFGPYLKDIKTQPWVTFSAK
jgi:hypothetical protein